MVCGILRRSPLLQLLAILLPQFAANGPLASLSANKTAVIRVPRKVVDGWQLNQATVGEFEDPHAITRRTGTRGRSMTPVFCTVLSFIIAALFLKRARREKEGSEYDPNEEWYYPSSPSNSRPASASPSNFQQGTTVDNPPDSEHPVESTLTASQLDIPTSELPSVFGDASSLPSEDAELYREPTPSSDSEDDQEKKPQPILGEQTVVRTAIAAQEAEIPVILRH
ncbi:hypothetical protein, conserved [Eimeria tenella]|uniref:Transmembrane protein n=1 Tax=Eimeria tenella TaxID=5802 RepID=U6KLS6_EIMTE|nr:hypothetical protein, conserved [Eimeria tenella]CDJ37786.1 hypothetical protein, conserved [Eimeria tenella]|eukprot:XP_013228624.1 hypothetical protein, conserved [Eimeria tenella]